MGDYGFKTVTALDFEFHQPPGEKPQPICLVARNLKTGFTQRFWADDLRGLKEPPFPVGPDSLSIAYYASAELSCFLSLGWPFPKHMLDLFTEFRCMTNGKFETKAGLLNALSYFGEDRIEFAEKEEMRKLAIRGGPFTDKEKLDLLEYCERDVVALPKLFLKMQPYIDL